MNASVLKKTHPEHITTEAEQVDFHFHHLTAVLLLEKAKGRTSHIRPFYIVILNLRSFQPLKCLDTVNIQT